jgi:hypothetical protein
MIFTPERFNFGLESSQRMYIRDAKIQRLSGIYQFINSTVWFPICVYGELLSNNLAFAINSGENATIPWKARNIFTIQIEPEYAAMSYFISHFISRTLYAIHNPQNSTQFLVQLERPIVI